MGCAIIYHGVDVVGSTQNAGVSKQVSVLREKFKTYAKEDGIITTGLRAIGQISKLSTNGSVLLLIPSLFFAFSLHWGSLKAIPEILLACWQNISR